MVEMGPAPAPGPPVSRLCVKNLPKHCDEKRLRQHFAQSGDGGDVTDVRVMRTKVGKSRLFGFVGFRTPHAAAAAQKHFERSFIDTSRIIIEASKPMGDDSLARPWSRYSQGSSAWDKKHPEEAKAAYDAKAKAMKQADAATLTAAGKKRGSAHESEVQAKLAADPKLAEFLELMGSKRKNNVWKNDDAGAAATAAGPSGPAWRDDASAVAAGGEAEGTAEDGAEGAEGEDEYQELPQPGQARAASAAQAKGEKAPAAAAPTAEGAEEAEVAADDLDYLRSKMVGSLDDDEDEGGDGGEEEEEEEEEGLEEATEGAVAREAGAAGTAGVAGVAGVAGAAGGRAAAEGEGEEEETLGEHGRLFVRNLPFDASEEELQEHFKPFGPVASLQLPTHRDTGRHKGLCYVSYSLGEHAVRAMAALDGQFFQGRILHVMAAKPLPEKEGVAAGGAALGFKAKREEQLKQQAESSHNWNSLFMRADAVGDALASRYGVEKRELLDTDAEASLAVRLAQGQTHLVQQTKQWLASHGVSLAALEQAASASASSSAAASSQPLKRSSTLILVKNLAAKVTQSELRALFSRHGQVAQVLLPPANTLALVEYLEVGEAKRAFRQLAYSKLHGSPLFLEWAPVGTVGPEDEDGAPPAAAAAAAAGGEEDAAETEGCTLFVKNLSFGTGEEALRQLFERHWKLRAASVVTKRDPKDPSRRLSMGYGFVEFSSSEDTQQALRKMHGSRLDDHVLQLKLSARPAAADSATGAAGAGGAKRAREPVDGKAVGGKGTPSAKLAVRNVPFEASKKELRELFAAFGQLKTVRLPKKFDGSHRGFAFVEFVSKQEATKALNALQSTHLYGRHIVVSYAEHERSVEEMRKKMRRELSDASVSLGARSMGDTEEGLEGAQDAEEGDLGFEI